MKNNNKKTNHKQTLPLLPFSDSKTQEFIQAQQGETMLKDEKFKKQEVQAKLNKWRTIRNKAILNGNETGLIIAKIYVDVYTNIIRMHQTEKENIKAGFLP